MIMHAFALTDEIRTAFNGVQLLLPGFEVEFLDICQHTDDERRHAYEDAQRQPGECIPPYQSRSQGSSSQVG